MPNFFPWFVLCSIFFSVRVLLKHKDLFYTVWVIYKIRNAGSDRIFGSVRFGSVVRCFFGGSVRFGSVRWKILTEPPNFLVKKWPEIGLFQLWFFQLFHEKFFKLFYKISENDFQHLDRCSPWLFREIFKQEKFGMVRFGSVTEIRFGSVRFGTVKSFSNSVRFGSVGKNPVRSFPAAFIYLLKSI